MIFEWSSLSDNEEKSLDESTFGGIGFAVSMLDFSFCYVTAYGFKDKDDDEDDELAIAFNFVNVASSFARPFSSRFLIS